MSELYVPARHTPLTKHMPFHPDIPESESEYPGIWDWRRREKTIWQTPAPLHTKRPSRGPEGVPETQPETNDLLNVALTVIAGLSIGVVVATVLRLILPRD